MHIEEKSGDIYMEMYNEGLVDNAAIIRGAHVPVEPPSLEQNPELNRVRRHLLIFIGINLVSELYRKIFNIK